MGAFQEVWRSKMALQLDIISDAEPPGDSKYRHWLSRTWNASGPTALVIGINPNTATKSTDDMMTRFLTTLLRGLDGEYKCGGYILVNCCDIRHPRPEQLQILPDPPCSPSNKITVQTMLARCEFIVASWGTTNYGKIVADARNEIITLVKQAGKKIICFSPRNDPIYCSRTNANSPDGRWSKTPVAWT
jgi:hypothetical protein